MTTYAGTEINPNPDFMLPAPEVRQQIVATFARLDLQPEVRARHFQWVSEHKGLNQVGWRGFISGLEPVPGGWLVEIHVMPKFEQPGGVVMTADYCTERYFYANGALEMLPFEHDHPHRGSLIQD